MAFLAQALTDERGHPAVVFREEDAHAPILPEAAAAVISDLLQIRVLQCGLDERCVSRTARR
jgi:hypothetical protein